MAIQILICYKNAVRSAQNIAKGGSERRWSERRDSDLFSQKIEEKLITIPLAWSLLNNPLIKNPAHRL
jgi:hypothetical protein